ncbi:basic proline-rich protein-like [Antechinus flavipes]|uniref:basic proline-rich protein-like n=1 Tax=Antechinus flavipes TaxID=38775 RepID=UPI002236369F|nr:basic proline-rich protein-like [Antechinus flavipes]
MSRLLLPPPDPFPSSRRLRPALLSTWEEASWEPNRAGPGSAPPAPQPLLSEYQRRSSPPPGPDRLGNQLCQPPPTPSKETAPAPALGPTRSAGRLPGLHGASGAPSPGRQVAAVPRSAGGRELELGSGEGARAPRGSECGGKAASGEGLRGRLLEQPRLLPSSALPAGRDPASRGQPPTPPDSSPALPPPGRHPHPPSPPAGPAPLLPACPHPLAGVPLRPALPSRSPQPNPGSLGAGPLSPPPETPLRTQLAEQRSRRCWLLRPAIATPANWRAPTRTQPPPLGRGQGSVRSRPAAPDYLARRRQPGSGPGEPPCAQVGSESELRSGRRSHPLRAPAPGARAGGWGRKPGAGKDREVTGKRERSVFTAGDSPVQKSIPDPVLELSTTPFASPGVMTSSAKR